MVRAFVVLFKQDEMKEVLCCGYEAVYIQTCHIDIRFGEIRYESSARIADRLRI